MRYTFLFPSTRSSYLPTFISIIPIKAYPTADGSDKATGRAPIIERLGQSSSHRATHPDLTPPCVGGGRRWHRLGSGSGCSEFAPHHLRMNDLHCLGLAPQYPSTAKIVPNLRPNSIVDTLLWASLSVAWRCCAPLRLSILLCHLHRTHGALLYESVCVSHLSFFSPCSAQVCHKQYTYINAVYE
jgi:hypothetical protein